MGKKGEYWPLSGIRGIEDFIDKLESARRQILKDFILTAKTDQPIGLPPRIALLFGAGVSKQALLFGAGVRDHEGAPLMSEIVAALLKEFPSVKGRLIARGKLENAIENQNEVVNNVWKELSREYSRVEAIKELQKILLEIGIASVESENVFPGLDHELIAHFTYHGVLRPIINLNFDELLEKAFMEEFRAPDVRTISTLSAFSGETTEGIRRGKTILKPHGTISRPLSLRFMSDQTENLDREKQELIRNVLSHENVLLVIHTSLRDPDMCDLLIDWALDKQKHKKTEEMRWLFYINYRSRKQEAEIEENKPPTRFLEFLQGKGVNIVIFTVKEEEPKANASKILLEWGRELVKDPDVRLPILTRHQLRHHLFHILRRKNLTIKAFVIIEILIYAIKARGGFPAKELFTCSRIDFFIQESQRLAQKLEGKLKDIDKEAIPSKKQSLILEAKHLAQLLGLDITQAEKPLLTIPSVISLSEIVLKCLEEELLRYAEPSASDENSYCPEWITIREQGLQRKNLPETNLIKGSNQADVIIEHLFRLLNWSCNEEKDVIVKEEDRQELIGLLHQLENDFDLDLGRISPEISLRFKEPRLLQNWDEFLAYDDELKNLRTQKAGVGALIITESAQFLLTDDKTKLRKEYRSFQPLYVVLAMPSSKDLDLLKQAPNGPPPKYLATWIKSQKTLLNLKEQKEIYIRWLPWERHEAHMTLIVKPEEKAELKTEMSPDAWECFKGLYLPRRGKETRVSAAGLTNSSDVQQLVEEFWENWNRAKKYENPPQFYIDMIEAFGREDLSKNSEDEAVERTKESPEMPSEAPLILQNLEQTLRTFIVSSLTVRMGDNWWIRGIPNDIRHKCTERKEKKEKAYPWLGDEEHDLIEYADFADYSKIIERKDNWDEIFKPAIGEKDVFLSKLRELEPIRNKITHSRRLNDTEKETLTLYYKHIKNTLQ